MPLCRLSFRAFRSPARLASASRTVLPVAATTACPSAATFASTFATAPKISRCSVASGAASPVGESLNVRQDSGELGLHLGLHFDLPRRAVGGGGERLLSGLGEAIHGEPRVVEAAADALQGQANARHLIRDFAEHLRAVVERGRRGGDVRGFLASVRHRAFDVAVEVRRVVGDLWMRVVGGER